MAAIGPNNKNPSHINAVAPEAEVELPKGILQLIEQIDAKITAKDARMSANENVEAPPSEEFLEPVAPQTSCSGSRSRLSSFLMTLGNIFSRCCSVVSFVEDCNCRIGILFL